MYPQCHFPYLLRWVQYVRIQYMIPYDHAERGVRFQQRLPILCHMLLCIRSKNIFGSLGALWVIAHKLVLTWALYIRVCGCAVSVVAELFSAEPPWINFICYCSHDREARCEVCVQLVFWALRLWWAQRFSRYMDVYHCSPRVGVLHTWAMLGLFGMDTAQIHS